MAAKKETKTTAAVQKVVSDSFTQAIEEYLVEFAKSDAHFAKCFANPKKTIVECCAYIVGQVQKMRVYGVSDSEVYQMARHYYLEEIGPEELKVQYQPNLVKVNKDIEVEITEEEKVKAKEKALKEYQAKVIAEEKKKAEKEKIKTEKKEIQSKPKSKVKQKTVEVPTNHEQLSLFGDI